ncbi:MULTISPECIES: hypothetical protein [Sphingobacterium]|uniref:hypothetical protein n=1 Tax=Sphingobacterium TaxID=28453 RepID=UPI0012FCF010|nr:MULTISPECIES: hypothetical protein [Sphingobacterium]UQA76175.1 hypothetical protein K2F45_04010 [Sphingobacterium siyangense]
MTKFLIGGDHVPAGKFVDCSRMNAIFPSLFEISWDEILVNYGKKEEELVTLSD